MFRLLSLELSTACCYLYAEGSLLESWEFSFSFLVGFWTSETMLLSLPIEKNWSSWIALLRSLFALVLMSSTWNLLIAMFDWLCISLFTILCKTFSISLSVGWLIDNYRTNPCYLISWFNLWEKSLFRNCLLCSLGSLKVKMNKGLFMPLVSMTYFSRISLKSAIS